MNGRLAMALALLFSFSNFSRAQMIAVGDSMPNFSWSNSDGRTTNLNDYIGKVRVLLYNGGFCPDCNSEFSELVPRVSEFNGKPVVFISLSVAGWQSDSDPDTQFLNDWKTQYKISFPVAASSRTEGKKFFTDLAIPNVVIVDQWNILTYKAIGPDVDTIFQQINQALANNKFRK